MVGLGEDRQSVLQVMDDMRSADIDFLTIGQYLQPTPKHHRVDRFVTPEEFKSYETAAFGKGFLMVSATPLTRSSYHAGMISPNYVRRVRKNWDWRSIQASAHSLGSNSSAPSEPCSGGGSNSSFLATCYISQARRAVG